MRILKPQQYQQQLSKKLVYSTSANDIKIKKESVSKKSLDYKNKSKGSSNQTINHQDCLSKLHLFLKDNNGKSQKNRGDYDYSAILEASKSNIQSRNKTTVNQKNEKPTTTKKSKNNQAFVFYRPK
jgi:hypothetical protein